MIKEFAIGLALRAGNLLMHDFRRAQVQDVRVKSKREIVTRLDIKVNDFLVRKIKAAYPQHAIMSEEQGAYQMHRADNYLWVVDPLDGTVNYTMHNPFFATHLALIKNGEPILGVIYAPYTRELFVAEKGKGARKNEELIQVSKESKLANSFLTFGYAHSSRSHAQAMQIYKHFEQEARGMRHFGSSSLELAFVACGRVEAELITPPVRSWDISAGVLLIKEAGGRVTDFQGNTTNITRGGLVASNAKIHQQIMRVIKKKKI